MVMMVGLISAMTAVKIGLKQTNPPWANFTPFMPITKNRITYMADCKTTAFGKPHTPQQKACVGTKADIILGPVLWEAMACKSKWIIETQTSYIQDINLAIIFALTVLMEHANTYNPNISWEKPLFALIGKPLFCFLHTTMTSFISAATSSTARWTKAILGRPFLKTLQKALKKAMCPMARLRPLTNHKMPLERYWLALMTALSILPKTAGQLGIVLAIIYHKIYG